MKTLTAKEFKRIISGDSKKGIPANPGWASTLTEPVEITEYCRMTGSKITHLSEHLHFSGRNKDGDCAFFWKCKSLKVAEGKFAGHVNFIESGIERIDPGKLVITRHDNNGNAATFVACKHLKTAEGIFPGFVDFSFSGIERIDPEKLIITQPNNEGKAAYFLGCESLKVAEGTFTGCVSFSGSGIENIVPERLIITQPDNDGDAASFHGCKALKVAEGTFPGFVSFHGSGIEGIGELEITRGNDEGKKASFAYCSKLKDINNSKYPEPGFDLSNTLWKIQATHTLTAEDFKRIIDGDPARGTPANPGWAATLTEPVEITGYCDMWESGITHLSEHLHFTGREESGNCAFFLTCESLKIAEGKFNGSVDFSLSGIERIDPEKLVITQPDNDGVAALFGGCESLKVAEGTFPGRVDFYRSGIEKIAPEKLLITQPDKDGNAADFHGCKALKVAEGTFPGFVSFHGSGIEGIGELEITRGNDDGKKASFAYCSKLKTINNSKYPEPGFDLSNTLWKIQATQTLTAEDLKCIIDGDYDRGIAANPGWADTLTESVEITGFCDMEDSGITKLSGHLHFTGRNAEGNCADFCNCKSLKIAEGKFDGFVSFQESGIKRIAPEKLVITTPNKLGYAADFSGCQSLKIAEGTFPGSVYFNCSGIESIDHEKLVITQPAKDGNAAIFSCCQSLKVAEGTFPGIVSFCYSGIKRIGKLDITPNTVGKKADFAGCQNLKEIRNPKYLGKEFEMDKELRQHSLEQIDSRKIRANAVEFEL